MANNMPDISIPLDLIRTVVTIDYVTFVTVATKKPAGTI